MKMAKVNRNYPILGVFPPDTVHGNPPARAADTGSIPGPGRSHMPRSNLACVHSY